MRLVPEVECRGHRPAAMRKDVSERGTSRLQAGASRTEVEDRWRRFGRQAERGRAVAQEAWRALFEEPGRAVGDPGMHQRVEWRGLFGLALWCCGWIGPVPRHADAGQWAHIASRRTRRADGRAKVHHRLHDLARFSGFEQFRQPVPGRSRCIGSAAARAAGACPDACDVAVCAGDRPVEGNRHDRAGRVRTDAAQCRKCFCSIGNLSVVTFADLAGGFTQIPRTPIITESLPELVQLLVAQPGTGRWCRDCCDDSGKAGCDGLDARLLQQKLADEHDPRIGAVAAPR